jgi:LacI family transcriptional regulator
MNNNKFENTGNIFTAQPIPQPVAVKDLLLNGGYFYKISTGGFQITAPKLYTMRTKPITLQDIANALGVSRATVSRALSDHPDISEPTKQRIAAVAKQMGYRANLLARGLSQQQTHVIGVVVPTIHRPFWANAISGIEAVAYQSGYRVMICQSDEQYQREVETVGALLNSMVDGLILAFAQQTRDFQHVQTVVDQGVPLLMLERVNSGLSLPRVVTDDFAGATLLTEHLLQTGYQRIAHISGPPQLEVCRERQRGYQTALARYQRKAPPEWVVESALTRQSAGEAFRQLMALPNPPDAIFCFVDIIATGALLAAQEMHCMVPDTVAIAGFGDDDLSQFIGLTTVSQPSFAMGQQAARLLLQEINRPGKTSAQSVTFTGELIVRASTVRN